MKRYDRFADPCPAYLAMVVAAVAGCAATGVMLRSNHYRVYVPPDWQVVASGGATNVPTVLRVPPPTDRPAGVMEIRLYPWLAQGPLADPAGDVLKHLADGGVLDLATATADDDQPCERHAGDLFMFGKPARSIHLKTTSGQRVVITAGHADGSLVGVVGILAGGGSACADVDSMDSAIKRLTGAMASTGDSTRPAPSPAILEAPNGRPIAIPPADPAPPAP